jgi:chromosome partitioning protein
MVPSMFLVPTDRNLTGAEIELVPMPQRESRLKRVVDALRPSFDFVFIDCPPSLGLLTLNALVAADAVLIPLHCEYFALEGLAELVGTMRRVRASFNPALDIEACAHDVRRAHESRPAGGARRPRVFLREKVFNTTSSRAT